jgi:ribonuclease-3 family protein
MAHDAFAVRDTRELNPLQMAYIGDTVHDLYVRSLLVSRGMTVGKMHKQAVRMVSAFAQARMLEAIEPDLTEEEADVARRGRNSQAKHAAPKHADPADYAHATGLEALWGWLYLSGRTQRLDELVKLALSRTEELWQKQNSK